MNYEAVDDFDTDTPSASAPWRAAALTVAPLLAVLGTGWALHERNTLDSFQGIGYLSGIFGVVALLIAVFRSMMSARSALQNAWLILPNLLALAGCGLIVVHANFQWGTRASAAALIAMLAITASSLLGLILGRRLTVATTDPRRTGAELQSDFARARAGMSEHMNVSPALKSYLEQFEAQELPRRSLLAGKCLRLRGLPDRLDAVRARAMKFLRQVLESRTLDEDWSPDQLQSQLVESTKSLGNYLTTLRAMAEYEVFHRLYLIWRIQHVLLLTVFILACSAHIYSVHAY